MDIKLISLHPAPAGFKPLAKSVEIKNENVSSPAVSKQQGKLKKACQDFEAVFLNHLLTKMRESIPKSDLMGNSRGEEIYRGLLDEELAKQMAVSGGTGLSNILYQHLVKNLGAPTEKSSGIVSGSE